MHEMMIEGDLPEAASSKPTTLRSGTDSFVDEPNPDKYLDDQDELARTGELPPSIRTSLVAPPAKKSGS
jgi:hypothetical protein